MNDYRLIYLWIERYKNIEKKALRFTLDYDINIDQNCINATFNNFGRSSQQNNNPFSSLDSFSAIVGPNGSGKSNVLELLKHLVCIKEFPSGENEASGFLIIERKKSDGSSYLYMITSSDGYSFKDGKITKRIDSVAKKAIYYNPIDEGYKAENLKIGQDNLYRIGHEPVRNKYSDSSTTNNMKQFTTFKEGLENYDIFKKVFDNSHARYVLQCQEIKNNVTSYCQDVGVSSSKLQTEWFKLLVNECKNILNYESFTFDSFIVHYRFLYACKMIGMKLSEGKIFNFDTANYAFLFTLLSYKHHNDNVEKALTPAMTFLNEMGLGSLYQDYYAYVYELGKKLVGLSSCFKDHETYGGCFVIPFNQPANFKRLNNLIVGIEPKGHEHNLIKGEDIFSSVDIEGLSSGELNIINFIGNLEEKLDNFSDIEPIILFDEVEHTFHPEWQRLLIHTLSKIFETKYIKPQVVLSTHSPFLLSDILNQKTLSLGNAKSAELNTFASNIHDILNSEFFMKRSIGESAAELIIQCANLIEELSTAGQEQGCDTKRMKARMIIDQVNDPVLKSELNSRLAIATANSNSLRKRLFEIMHGDFTDAELVSELEKLQ